MRNPLFAVILTLIALGPSFAQEGDKSIVQIIDELTVQWDEGAEKMKTYASLKEFCRIKPYRDKTIKLLDQIHHYDTVLYLTVTEKFNVNKDPEAKATLDDINTLEVDYTTASFKRFLHRECNTVNMIENNLKEGTDEFNEEVALLEDELGKYIQAITTQVDVIDDHIHHLKGLE